MAGKKKLTVAVLAFVGMTVLVTILGCAAAGSSMPQRITAESPCPVTRCANGVCHGYENVPKSDGVTLMECPEVSCSSAQCHAWDTLVGRYHHASDMSLNLWVLAPALVSAVALVLLGRTRRKSR